MRIQSPIMVGRDEDLATLVAALDETLTGRGVTAVVRGEAGIGKSRLVDEFLRGPVATRGATGITGACLDIGGGGLPYAAYLELLRRLRRALDPDRWASIVEPSVPSLAPLLAIREPRPNDDPGSVAVNEARRANLFGTVLDVFSAVAEARPLVIVVEDLHWADLATLELTAFLVRNLHAAPVLLVMTIRSDEVPRDGRVVDLLQALLRDPAHRRLDLARLPLEALHRQVQAITQSISQHDELEELLRRSGGNPYLAEELIALAAAHEPQDIPMAARDILLARLSGLPHDAQSLVAAVAIGGTMASIAQLRAVLGDPASERPFDAVVAETVRHGVLVLRHDDDGLEFRHALAREATIADLLGGERRRWHERWAATLESMAADTPSLAAEIARHRDGAGHWDLARDWWLRAASVAAGALAFDTAADAYHRAIERSTGPRSDGSGPSTQLLAEAARAMRFAGRSLEAVGLTERAIASLSDVSPTGRAELLERLGTYRIEIGDNEGAVAATHEAVELLADGPPEAWAQAALSHATCLVHLLRLDGVAIYLEPAIRIAREHGLIAIEAMARCQRALAAALTGDLDHAAIEFDQAWQLALASGDPEAIVLTALDRPSVPDSRGDYEAALDLNLEGIAVAQRLGIAGSFDALGILTNTASILVLLGRWLEAEQLLKSADVQDPLGRMRGETLQQRARIAAYRGDAEAALLALGRPRLELGAQAASYHGIVAGEAALLRGDHDAALDLVLESVRGVAPPGTVPGLRQRAEAAVLASAAAAAIVARRIDRDERRRLDARLNTLIDDLESALREMPPSRTDRLVEAWQSDLEAWAHRLAEQPDHEAWARSVEVWSRMAMPYHQAWAIFHQAEGLLDARRDRPLVAPLLGEALTIARDLGARPLSREIKDLARRSRIVVGGTESEPDPAVRRAVGVVPHSADLTARERDVLGLLVAGRSNREIAAALFISPKTAGVHVSNILSKLEVRGRVEAATLAIRDGLLEK